jgi:L-ribulose-5-phosphate 4-epimerase
VGYVCRSYPIGKNATAAVKAAVMTEDAAATAWVALQIGTLDLIPQEDVEKPYYCYTDVYGQQTAYHARLSTVHGLPLL